MNVMSAPMWETEGVLPPDTILPRFSIRENRLGMPHRDWFNSFLARLLDYAADIEEQTGRYASLKGFYEAEARSGPNTVDCLHRLSGLVAEVAGLEVKMGRLGGLVAVSPRSLTDAGAQYVLEEYYLQKLSPSRRSAA